MRPTEPEDHAAALREVGWLSVRELHEAYVHEAEQNDTFRQALTLIAAEKRADGTYNRDREACGELAREALYGSLPLAGDA